MERRVAVGRVLAVLGIFVGVAVVLVLVFSDRSPTAGSRSWIPAPVRDLLSTRPVPPPPVPAASSVPVVSVLWEGLSPLARLELQLFPGGIVGKRIHDTAADLRFALRSDPAARAEAAARLLDPASGTDLRAALALVFGTLGGADVDPLLLEALRKFPDDAAFVRCALLALGGTREPEEDDAVFDLGDRPWGATGPGGIGITVKRVIADPAVRREAATFLARPEAEVREAAATALRHSVDAADVRDAFLGALGREPADGPAVPLGEALARRAGDTGEPEERRRILEALLARGGDPALDAFRFRLEDDFGRIPLEDGERAALAALAAPDRPFGVRSFALAAATASAARGPGAAPTRDLLRSVLAGDRDPAARDLAARLLARLPFEAEAGAALAAAAKGDGAWNVRFTALDTLAAIGPRPEVLAALAAAAADPDPRVAARAAELRKSLP